MAPFHTPPVRKKIGDLLSIFCSDQKTQFVVCLCLRKKASVVFGAQPMFLAAVLSALEQNHLRDLHHHWTGGDHLSPRGFLPRGRFSYSVWQFVSLDTGRYRAAS